MENTTLLCLLHVFKQNSKNLPEHYPGAWLKSSGLFTPVKPGIGKFGTASIQYSDWF